MTNTFTDQQIHEIRLSADIIAADEMVNRNILDEEIGYGLAAHLFQERDRWASFDADSDADAYEPIIDEFFANS